MYLYSTQLADHGVKHMEKKNMSFTKDGMKVRVKDINAEDYEDKTQRYNLSSSNCQSSGA
jgi:hypothetical protein